MTSDPDRNSIAAIGRPYRRIDVRPYAPNLGAEVRGIDLTASLDDETFEEVRRAFLDHQVLFFCEQSEVPPDRHIELAKKFGELHRHPAAPHLDGYPEIFVIHAHSRSKIANGEFWHSDVSCDTYPPLGTMLQIHVMPPSGGDTLFADMYGAYEALSEPLRTFLDGLTSVHESEHIYRGRYRERGVDDTGKTYPTAVHPVV